MRNVWKPFEHQIGLRKANDGTIFQDRKPIPHRTTMTIGVYSDGKNYFMGSSDASTALAATTGLNTIQVDDNAFDKPVQIRIGSYTLTSGIDFQVGVDAAETAQNIKAAINLTHVGVATCPALSDTVTVSWLGVGKVEFEAIHSGIVANLVLTPTTGFLAQATPALIGSETTV